MFYFFELYFRLQYSLICFLLIFSCCYIYKNQLFFFFIFFLLNVLTINNVATSIDHFIYTHPVELFNINFFLLLFFVFLIYIPYLLWQLFDFLKPSFYLFEYIQIKQVFLFFFSLIYCLNYLGFLFVLPKLWIVLITFNANLFNFSSLQSFFELKLSDYFIFLFQFFYFINVLIISILLLYLLINFFSLQNLLKWKKFFIFCNLFVATFLTPPDIFSQLSVLLILCFLLELFIYIMFISLILKKYFYKYKIKLKWR